MTSAFNLSVNDQGIATLVFDLPNEKVNKFSIPVLNELEAILSDLAKNSKVKALVIRSAKPDIFIAGADLKTFEDAFLDPPLVEKIIRRGHEVFDRLTELPFPTIAVIDGVCLGGGTEFALACKYRLVTDNPKTQIGLPEVTLGIMPGWGGTQRLPRLIGLQEALNMILTGKSVDGKKAYKIKLADAISHPEFVDAKLAEFLEECTTREGQLAIYKRRRLHGIRHALMEANPIGRALLFHLARKSVLSKTKGHYPAPLVALNVLKETATMNLKDGLNYEIEAFAKAVPNKFQKAINLIKLFFANEALKKNPGLPEGVKAKEVKSGAVIGAGTMGAGIAWLFSNADIPVRFKDINWKVVAKGYESAYGIYKKLLKIRKIKPYEVARKFQLLSGTVDYSGFSRADIVIEAATENLDLKHKIFAELEEVVRPDAIIASNTSSLPISEMSKHLKHPERFLGMHFFNPPNRMPLVEIIAGEKTSPEALATAVELCKRFKKVPLIVRDCPGFLVNRIFAAAANESSWMLQEGVEMERLDRIVTDFGMPMGPCALSDEVGNDVAYKVFHTFEDSYGPRMRSPQIVKAMFDAGLYGKKTSKGYYIYDGKVSKENIEVKALLKRIDGPRINNTDQEILDRFILGMVNEAARCLEEGIVSDPMYVDMALLYGMGFPPFRTGLLHYADKQGIPKIVETLKEFSKRYGERFTPCDKLVDMARNNESFYNPREKFSERLTCTQKDKTCACSHS